DAHRHDQNRRQLQSFLRRTGRRNGPSLKSNAKVSEQFPRGGTSSNFGDTIANSSLQMSTSKHMQNIPVLRLRKATPADAALVARMHAQSWAAAYRGILPDTYLDDEVPRERAAHWARRMDEIDAGD